jgi:hypothetical protein
MKRPLIDRIHDRLWTITGDWLDIKRPLPSVECIATDDGSISGTMDWPRACAALASGALTSKNFRRIHAVRQVVETLGPVDGKHFARWIRDNASSHLTDKRVAAIDAWGDPIRWPAACLGTPRAFSPTTLRFLAHALWLKKEGFVKEGGTVVEIGVGFGGLAAMNAIVSNATTIMIDLPPVAKAAMLQMRELGLGNFAFNDKSKFTAGDVCFISNYAFTELSREMQDAYVDNFIHHADRGAILSNAAVFAHHMKSRNNDQIIDLLKSHNLPAKISTNDPILCQSDIRFGNALVLWKRIS